MKLTKQTLKQIIKEELDAMLEQSTDDLMAKRNQVVAIAPRIRRSNAGEVSYLVRIGDSGGDIYYINKESWEKFKKAERSGMKRSDAESIISAGQFSELNDTQLAAVADTFQQTGDRSL
tara:strand:- start:1971 stop:2327 length:357 start_codon:yes stop_codon:yes gene_type:complete